MSLQPWFSSSCSGAPSAKMTLVPLRSRMMAFEVLGESGDVDCDDQVESRWMSGGVEERL